MTPNQVITLGIIISMLLTLLVLIAQYVVITGKLVKREYFKGTRFNKKLFLLDCIPFYRVMVFLKKEISK